MESFVIDRRGSPGWREQGTTRFLLASANSLKAMIQPSIPQNGTFKNPIYVARFRFRAKEEIGTATIVSRFIPMFKHEVP